MLTQVDSDFPDEGTVDYEYGGNMKRRSRTVGSDRTWYNYRGWSLQSEETQAVVTTDGTLDRTYFGGMGDVAGTNPATGTARYYTQDHLGSTVGGWDSSKGSLGTASYTPFGGMDVVDLPSDVTRRYTGHHWDATAQLHAATFRFLNSGTGRWMKRDPLGMINGPNMYGYVGGNPINWVDPFGLSFWSKIKDGLGKLAASSATANGLLWGLLGGGDNQGWNPDANAFEIMDSPIPGLFDAGAICIGNTTHYAPGVDPEDYVAGDDPPYTGYPAKRRTHEKKHTYQWQNLGPFFLPLYLLKPDWFEKEADFYSLDENSDPYGL
jgi:RHS repeat-associated protein